MARFALRNLCRQLRALFLEFKVRCTDVQRTMAAMSTTGLSPARQNYSYIKDNTIAGAKYAVRIINDGAFSPSDTFQTRYKLVVDGCGRWSNLRHPNIVPFLGMNTSNNKSIPSLLMEYLPTNLHQFLKSQQAKPTPSVLRFQSSKM